MAKENKSRFAILGMLTYGPASGYDIKKTMQGSTAYFWRESDSSIYPMLKELTRDGLVKVSTESQGQRERKVYTITKAGRDLLVKWLEAPADETFVRNELLLKLFFSNLVPEKQTRKKIAEFKKQLLRKKVILQEIEKSLQGEKSESQPYWLMTLRYGQLQVETALKWCTEIEGKKL